LSASNELPLLTPTQVTAWLGCAHTMTLTHRVAAGAIPRPAPVFGSFADLLREKGEAHERAHLDALTAAGRDVLEVPGRRDDETFAQWASRSRALLAAGHDVLYQFPLVHDGIRGVADFLERVEVPSELGPFSYEPVDAKLARSEAKPGHVLQLCAYADALASLQGIRPRTVHLELGSGQRETIVLATVDAYWRRLRRQLAVAVEQPTDTVARPCAQCDLCEFREVCTAEWRGRDALHYVAGIRSTEVELIEAAGTRTLTGLAEGSGPVPDLREERLVRLRRQATLQLVRPADGPPPWEALERPEDGTTEELAARLPEPDDGDVVLDFEGHPFWRADRGLFFLFGALVRDPAAADGWTYRSWWAHDDAGEARIVSELIEWLAARRLAHPRMHVLHYNHTERTSLVTLADRHGAHPELLAKLIAQGVFVDLLEVVKHTVRIGAESYGLKQVELIAGYARGHDIDAGAGAVVGYERWTRSGEQAELDAIASYNEDDVRATLAVRTWLLDGVLAGVPPRPAPEFTAVEDRPMDAIIAALTATGEPWKVLLGQLLEYWAREWRTLLTQALAQLDGEEADHLRRPDVVGGLEYVRFEGPTPRQDHGTVVLRYPPQRFEARVRGGHGPRLTFPHPDGLPPRLLTIRDHDTVSRELRLAWPDEVGPAELAPRAMVAIRSTNPDPKPAALLAFAERVVADALLPSDAARVALLRRDLPRFSVDGPEVGLPVPEDALAPLVARLDRSTLAVQGPPGTGKTWTGARTIVDLVRGGQRIGITAFSHAAIDNLVDEVLRVDPTVRVLRQKQGGVSVMPRAGVTLSPKVAAAWDPVAYDVIAATTWPMTTLGDADEPVLDLLVIDEAGQLGLADAIAAMGCARSVLLLGDPLQLAQVAQAVHPDGADRSTLEHVLGEAVTMPDDRGLFLATTRRLHPAIARVISEQVYEGRLHAHEDCAVHALDGEAGLRWIRAVHTGRSTESPEEAAIIASVARGLIGRPWADSGAGGPVTKPLPADRIMVITPYNDHVDLVRSVLDEDPVTAGVRVGTVDKLQGQEAAVVIFSMATSSGEDLTRSVDFLFSRNRLNVAVSRARALAYVVCTDELLDTRAKDLDTMQLIGTLCALVEAADEVPVRGPH
jgi:predicted RecB family nuclease